MCGRLLVSVSTEEQKNVGLHTLRQHLFAVFIQSLQHSLLKLLAWHERPASLAVLQSPPRSPTGRHGSFQASGQKPNQNMWEVFSAVRKDTHFGFPTGLKFGLLEVFSDINGSMISELQPVHFAHVSIGDVSALQWSYCRGPTEVQDCLSLHPKQHSTLHFKIKISTPKINILSPVTFVPGFPSHARTHTTRYGRKWNLDLSKVLTHVSIQVHLQELVFIRSVISLLHAL